MGKTQEKAVHKRLYFIFIPIIAFVIGYFSMTLIQTFNWDNFVFDRKASPKLDFSAKEQSAAYAASEQIESPIEGTADIAITEKIEFPAFEVYFVQAGTFATAESALKKTNDLLSKGYAATTYKDQVIRVLIACATDEATVTQIISRYKVAMEPLAMFSISLAPEPLDLDLHYDHGSTDKAIAYILQLLKEAMDFMSTEESGGHTKKEFKAFVASQKEGLSLLRDALREASQNQELERVRENVLQLADQHEALIEQWTEEGLDLQRSRWQGLLEELFEYTRIVR